MRRVLALACALTLAGCASSGAPNAPVLRDAAAVQSVVPGQTTRAQLQAALGDGTAIRFASEVEARLYLTPEGTGAYREFVVLIDAGGVVVKTRRGALITPSR